MPQLRSEFLERVEGFCDRVVDMAEALAEKRHPRRIVDQMVASGTSVGANVCEADEAMTKADFVKCLCITVKELNGRVSGYASPAAAAGSNRLGPPAWRRSANS